MCCRSEHLNTNYKQRFMLNRKILITDLAKRKYTYTTEKKCSENFREIKKNLALGNTKRKYPHTAEMGRFLYLPLAPWSQVSSLPFSALLCPLGIQLHIHSYIRIQVSVWPQVFFTGKMPKSTTAGLYVKWVLHIVGRLHVNPARSSYLSKYCLHNPLSWPFLYWGDG